MSNIIKLLILISLFGCLNEKKEETQSSPTSNPVEKSVSEIKGIPFPHTKEFKSTGQHGQMYMKFKKTCTACHQNMDVDHKDRNTCMKCHENFPHREGFDHGSSYLKSKKSCKKCHSDEISAKESHVKSAPNCKSCHNTYPHQLEWMGSHGAVAKKGDFKSCNHCHQEKLEKKHKLKNLKCNSCHTQMPHPTDVWIDDGTHPSHHAQVIKVEGVSNCRKCHGEDILQSDVTNGDMGNAKFCSDCH